MGDCLMLNRIHAWLPEFTYTGEFEVIGDNKLNVQWQIRFLSDGVLTILNPNSASRGIDAFLVGGGGGGACAYSWYYKLGGAAGGGSGYTATVKNLTLERGGTYEIVVGQGGKLGYANDTSAASATAGAGTASIAFGATANGGVGAGASVSSDSGVGRAGNGGSGGSIYAQFWNGSSATEGGKDGNDGTRAGNPVVGSAGTGQHTTTRAFGDPDGDLYAQGGGTSGGTPQTSNTGNGGNGGYNDANRCTDGCSGVVIIRLHR